jgi:hypothetical protein
MAFIREKRRELKSNGLIVEKKVILRYGASFVHSSFGLDRDTDDFVGLDSIERMAWCLSGQVRSPYGQTPSSQNEAPETSSQRSTKLR